MWLPGFLTLCNLLCGCAGIVAILQDKPEHLAYYVWAACLFDFADGFVARTLHVTSSIGKELDALADMISFGLAPGLLMYKLLDASSAIDWLPYLGFLITAFSAVRLAIFNTDPAQQDSFRGVPTPANALLLSALPFLPAEWVLNTASLVVICLVFSVLLVAPIRLLALKFKHFRWSGNEIKYIFILSSLAFVSLFGAVSLPFIILGYIVVSLALSRSIT